MVCVWRMRWTELHTDLRVKPVLPGVSRARHGP